MITYTRSAGHPLEHQIHGVRFICLCPGAVHTAMQVYMSMTCMTIMANKQLELRILNNEFCFSSSRDRHTNMYVV